MALKQEQSDVAVMDYRLLLDRGIFRRVINKTKLSAVYLLAESAQNKGRKTHTVVWDYYHLVIQFSSGPSK